MGDKTPMFNAFNINFYRAGLEDADANGTFIHSIVLATTSMVLNASTASRGKLFSFQSCYASDVPI